jgi:hypothetical protein
MLDTNCQEGYFSLTIIAKTKAKTKALTDSMQQLREPWWLLRRGFALDGHHLRFVFAQGNVREGVFKIAI